MPRRKSTFFFYTANGEERWVLKRILFVCFEKKLTVNDFSYFSTFFVNIVNTANLLQNYFHLLFAV